MTFLIIKGASPVKPESSTSLSTEGWHPLVQLAYEHWRSLHPATGLPGRQHLDPFEIPRRLLSGIWLLDVQREPFRLRYRLAGTAIVRAIGREVTGQWLDDAHPHLKTDPT